MRFLSVLLILGLSLVTAQGEAASCLLENFSERLALESPASVVREASFFVNGSPVTRILPRADSAQRTRDIFEYLNGERIVLTRGPAPVAAEGSATTFISVPAEALASEAGFTNFIELLVRSKENVPLNLERLTPASRAMVEQMQTKFRTRMVAERDSFGVSVNYHNQIGLRELPNNMRLNGFVTHEITHNTTDRKVVGAFNPQRTPGRVGTPFSETLAGREMSFRSKGRRPFEGASPVEGYETYYRSDEIEAHFRELATAKKDGLPMDAQLSDLNAFIGVEKSQLEALLRNPRALRISNGDAEDALGAGRRQRRVVTSPELGFEVNILVPVGLSTTEERLFIESTFRARLRRIESLRTDAQTRFPSIEDSSLP